MLSGRYRSCWLRRHWTDELGACRRPDCGQVPGDVPHLLTAECPALQPYLATTFTHILAMLSPNKELLSLWLNAVTSDKKTASILTSLILIIFIFSFNIIPFLHIN